MMKKLKRKTGKSCKIEYQNRVDMEKLKRSAIKFYVSKIEWKKIRKLSNFNIFKRLTDLRRKNLIPQ